MDKEAGRDRGERAAGALNGDEASARAIAAASGVAFLLAAVALAVAVLPVAYGLDPVGTGALFGWGPAEEGDPGHSERTDEVDLVLSPGTTLRWGFEVQEGAWMDHRWNASVALNATIVVEPAGETAPMTIDASPGPVDNESGGFRMPAEGRVVFIWSLPEHAQGEADISLWTSGSYRLLGALR